MFGTCCWTKIKCRGWVRWLTSGPSSDAFAVVTSWTDSVERSSWPSSFCSTSSATFSSPWQWIQVSYIIIPIFPPPQRHYWFADLQTPFFRRQMFESFPGFHIVSKGFLFREGSCQLLQEKIDSRHFYIHVVAICVCIQVCSMSAGLSAD